MSSAGNFIFIAFGSIILLAACHPASKVAGEKKNRKGKIKADTALISIHPKTDTTGKTSLTTESAALAANLNKKAFTAVPFRTLAAKAKMRYEQGDDSKEFTAHLRIDSGKAVWVNITALGGMVNVGRALITPDSIRFINYLQQEAILMPFSESGRLLPVPLSFSDLHAVLLGCAPDVPPTMLQSMQVIENELRVFNGASGLEQVNAFSLPDTVLKRYQVTRTGSERDFVLQMSLQDFSGEPASRFPQSRTINLNSNQKKSLIQMDLEDVQWNGSLSMPFSIPKNYTVR